MSEHPMETTLRSALWRQFGAAIDMLENALFACPSTLWTGLLWSDPEAPAYPTFWSLTHHTLFWLDLYLTGSLEGFAPPTPFTTDEFGPARVLPQQPYPKEELHAYLVQLRQKCQITLLSLSDEQAQREVAFPWRWWKPMSFFELQLYALRHVQEHAAQLSLFLGQHGIPGEALDWVARAKEEPGN
jgi:hypothetical protein